MLRLQPKRIAAHVDDGGVGGTLRLTRKAAQRWELKPLPKPGQSQNRHTCRTISPGEGVLIVKMSCKLRAVQACKGNQLCPENCVPFFSRGGQYLIFSSCCRGLSISELWFVLVLDTRRENMEDLPNLPRPHLDQTGPSHLTPATLLLGIGNLEKAYAVLSKVKRFRDILYSSSII